MDRFKEALGSHIHDLKEASINESVMAMEWIRKYSKGEGKMGNSFHHCVKDIAQIERLQQSLDSQVTSLSYTCSGDKSERFSRLLSTIQELGYTIQRIKDQQIKFDIPSFEEGAINRMSFEDDHVNQAVAFNLNCFHEKYANFPKTELYQAFTHLEPILESVKKHLYPDIHRFEYTGSAFTALSIQSRPLEFEVVIIFDAKYSELVYCEGLKKGYAQIKPVYGKHRAECDDMGFLNPQKYRSYFNGLIRKWCHKMNDFKIQFVEEINGSKLNIFKDDLQKEFWYCVDLIPCFEFKLYEGVIRYVPNPVKANELAAWRRTYIMEEKKMLKDLNAKADERMKVARTAKALVQLNPMGKFRELTAYSITTILFTMKDKYNPSRSYRDSVIDFLKTLRNTLKHGIQQHYFEDSINLLEGIHVQNLKNMHVFLDKIIKDEDEFAQYLIKLCGVQQKLARNPLNRQTNVTQ